VSDVRRIVDDLRPPSLDGLGLVGALSEVLDQFEGGPVAMRLAVDAGPEELDRLPAAVEVAAYRIVAEALTNAVRHARPTTVLVGVCAEGPDLVVSVEDDGDGIGPEVDLGVGLGSMHERAAELGGTCALDSSGRGTRVVARLPRGGA
jgi:two-component system, NarL family, sensor kinase